MNAAEMYKTLMYAIDETLRDLKRLAFLSQNKVQRHRGRVPPSVGQAITVYLNLSHDFESKSRLIKTY